MSCPGCGAPTPAMESPGPYGPTYYPNTWCSDCTLQTVRDARADVECRCGQHPGVHVHRADGSIEALEAAEVSA